ncbi:MAG: hypothetical protein IK092_02300, partial [Muribaculaceae bacterium]|nr:hypothetical protein [Muribaculaceae bacterium]
EIQLISKLLGVEFDTLWQREKRRVRTRIILWALGLIAVAAIVAAVWLGGRPVDVNVSLNEVTVHNQNLPDTTAIVTLMLDNEVKSDTLPSVAQAARFANVPHDFVGKEVRLTFNSYGWVALDTMVKLDKSLTLNINRDPEVWGMVNFTLKNETTDRYMPNTELIVGGRKVKSDSEGRVKLVFPLPDQRRSYPLQADFPLADTVIYPDNETTGAIVTAYPINAPTTIELVD